MMVTINRTMMSSTRCKLFKTFLFANDGRAK
jgi:hypothetical protein